MADPAIPRTPLKPEPVRTASGRSPLLWAALLFAAGIWGGTRLWRPPLWWLVAILAFLLAATYFLRLRPRLALVFAMGSLILLGALSIEVRPMAVASSELLGRFTGGNKVAVTGHVSGEGLVRDWGGLRQSLNLETEQLADDYGAAEVRAGLRLTVYSGEPGLGERPSAGALAPRFFTYGQRLRFTAKLRPPRNFGNPGAFDYRGYLAEQGIAALGSAAVEKIELLPGFTGNRFELWRTRVHRSVLEKIHSLWPPRQAALMDAMVIGEESFLDRDTRVDFRRSGTYHILVVSGMNLGILAFVVFWGLRRLHLGEVVASAATMVLAIFYAELTDAGAPIWRATLMLALYLGTRLLYRDRSPQNAVGGAALGLLLIDPRALFSPSFQLTFLSVLAIAGIGLPLLEHTSEPYRRALRNFDSRDYDAKLPPRLAQFRLDLRLFCERLARFLGERLPRWLVLRSLGILLACFDVLLISALMQVTLALPMAAYFHRATVTALPANALVVPLTELLMPAAVTGVALAYVWAPLARAAALLAAISLEGITGTVRLVGGWRVADVRVPAPELAPALAAVAALALALALARRRALWAWLGVFALAASSFWIAALPRRPQIRRGILEITAIDVGQGDATLVISPQGRTLLIDAGGSLGPWRSTIDIGEDVIAPYLWSRGISRLDALALTHAHADHIGGMPGMMANFHPRELWLGPNAMTRPLADLLRLAAEQKVTVVRRHGGDVFQFGGAEVRVLSPPPDWQVKAQPRNTDSLAMKFSYGKTAVLLLGDAEKRNEPGIVEQQPQAGLLKVAHNGSKTSTSPELLRAVGPRFAVISVGARNPFGHPRMEVLELLAQSRVSTYRTDLNGAVTFYLDGESITPHPAVLR